MDTIRCAGACGALVLIILCGCGRHSSDPAPAGEDDVRRIDWIHPVDGDSLADTIRVEIVAEGVAPARVVLSANGETVGERDRPPWRFQWLPASDSPHELTLLATAYSDAEETAHTTAIKISWSPNQPPIVRFVAPFDARAVARSAVDSLVAEAIDPEEGRLVGDALVWVSSLQGVLGYGERIPLDALVLGRHHLRVRATDAWQRSGWEERDLEVFEYRGGATPEGTLQDIRYALIAGDPDVYEESLAPDFRFIFCLSERLEDPEVPSLWDWEDESAFVRGVLLGEDNDLVALNWTVASVQPAIIGEQEWAKVELTGIDLSLAVGGIDTLSVVSGAARVYLSHTGRWRVKQWQDLGVDAGISQGRLRLLIRSGLDKRYLGR